MNNVIKPEHNLRDQLLHVMIDNKGSDMYITVGAYPCIRIAGDITAINEGVEKFTWKDTLEFTQSIIDEKQHDKLIREKNLDFSFGFGGARFRVNVSFQMGSYMVVMRLLESRIPDLDKLGLPSIYKDVMKRGQGLILITGPTSSGKTTTLAAMLDYINTNYKKHVITIEDPIEFVHTHKMSIFEQKEIGKDIPDYRTALMGAMRQAPQVILFGEMRTKEEVEMALTLAETGHLVLSTLHTRSAPQTVSRIIDIFAEGEKDQIRMGLSDALVAVFSQRLLQKIDGTGVHLVKEILINNDAIANLIRENDIHQIPTAMQMGKKEGMCLLEDDIIGLIQAGEISTEEGMKFANNPKLIQSTF